MPDKISQDEMAANYGYALAVLRSNPELYRVFKRAIKGDGGVSWTSDRFVAAVRNTSWFKHTAASARNWFVLSKSDPATANQQLQQRESTLSATAHRLGVKLSAASLSNLALQSVMNGWDDTQIQTHLAAAYHYSSGPQTGLAATTVDQLKQIAADYLVPLSSDAINRWTTQIVAGNHTTDDFKAYAESQAHSMFPQLAGAITKGTTVAQYLDPYKQIAANELNIDPESVDWQQPKWNKIFTVEAGTGVRSIMNQADWTTTLRSDPTYGWDKTAVARNAGTSLAGNLSRMFGVG